MEIYGIIGGGLMAGVAIFISKLLYDRYNKPNLEIEGEFTRKNITVNEKWTEVGVEVRNSGKRVAKNCRGVLTITDFASHEDIVDIGIGEELNVAGLPPPDDFQKEMGWRQQHRIETTKERARDLSKVNAFLDRKIADIDFNEKEVPWDHTGTPINLNINKGDKNRLFIARFRWDPLHVGAKFDMIDIPSGRGWDILHVVLRPDKTYECTLKISSANADSVERKFRLDVSGRIYFDQPLKRKFWSEPRVPTWP